MSLMVKIVVNEMWFYHHLVKVLKDIYKCKNYILKILMTNIVRDFAYSGENALFNLYNLFVDELESKITGRYLNVGANSFLIYFEERHFWRDKLYYKIVRYLPNRNDEQTKNDFNIRINFEEGKLPTLQITHLLTIPHELFRFPLNNVIVKEQPISCFNKWIEIAVNGMPTHDKVAEFDTFINIKKEHCDYKFKLDYLQRSAARRQPYTYMKNIESDPYLSRIIYENGPKDIEPS